MEGTLSEMFFIKILPYDHYVVSQTKFIYIVFKEYWKHFSVDSIKSELENIEKVKL